MYSVAYNPWRMSQLFRRKPIADLLVEGDQSLKRVMGAGDLIMLAIGAVIGAGIFVIPAAVARGLGPAAPLAFIAMSIPMLRDRAMVAAAVVAGITVIAAHALPLKLSIAAAALAGIAAGLLFEKRTGASG